jgi:Tol biopolymer transport system component
MPRKFFSLLLISLMLTACVSQGLPHPTEIIEETEDSTETEHDAVNRSFGEIYLLESTIDTPFKYRLVRLPSTCLQTDVTCPKPEIVPQFPETEFYPTSISLLHWSPDGSLALFMNGFNSRLLMLDPASLSVNQIPGELSMISDQMAWSPDGQWAALEVESSDSYMSRILLVNPRSSETRVLQIGLEGMLEPLAWLDTDRLLIFLTRYDYTGGDTTQKKDIAEESIYKIALDDLQPEVFLYDIPLNGADLAVSPDKRWIALSMVRNEKSLLEIYSMDGQKTQSYPEYVLPVWSPDGRWVAVTHVETSGFSVTLLNPEVNEERKLITLDYMPEYVWSPDSLNLMILSRTSLEEDNGVDFLYVFSTAGEKLREIRTTDIIEGNYRIDGISIKPDTQISRAISYYILAKLFYKSSCKAVS